MLFTLGYLSSRYDAPAFHVAEYCVNTITTEHVDVLCVDEMRRSDSNRIRKDIVKQLNSHYGSKKFKAKIADEYMIVWESKSLRQGRRTLGKPKIKRLTHNWTGSDSWRNFDYAVKDLVAKHSKKVLRLRWAHWMSGVQYGSVWRTSGVSDPTKRMSTHILGTTRLGSIIDTSSKKNPLMPQVTAGDCNVDQNNWVWQQYMENNLNSDFMFKEKDLPKPGTHGNRLIDGIWGRNVVFEKSWVSKVRPKHKSLDHIHPVCVRIKL